MKKIFLLAALLPLAVFFLFLAPHKAKAASMGGYYVYVKNSATGQAIGGATVTVQNQVSQTYSFYNTAGGYFYTYNGDTQLPCSIFAFAKQNSNGTLSGTGTSSGTTDGNGFRRATQLYTITTYGVWGQSCFCNWTGWDQTGSYVGYKVTVSASGYFSKTFNTGLPNDWDKGETVYLDPVPPPTTPQGWIDQASCPTSGTMSGWARDAADLNYQSAIHLYETDTNQEWHNAKFIGSTTANVASADVGNHRFSYSTPSSFNDNVQRYIWAYAFNRFGTPYLLSGNPKPLKCPPPDLCSLTADKSPVSQGGKVTLTWQIRQGGATPVNFTISQNPGSNINISSGGASSGTIDVYPSVDTTYSISGVAGCNASVPVDVTTGQDGGDTEVPSN